MEINGKEIADQILDDLHKTIQKIASRGVQPPKLIVFAIEPNEETRVFMKNKKRAAEKIGAICGIKIYEAAPSFEDFMRSVQELCGNTDATGAIIQLPLPTAFLSSTLNRCIPPEKEIEGFSHKPIFDYPIGLAVLTILSSIYNPEKSIIYSIHDFHNGIRHAMKNKRIVLLGRGATGGIPIGNTLSKAKISYVSINSSTDNNIRSKFISEGDIIITAVGKKIITPDMIKPQSVLISVGMRKDGDLWKGDYEDHEIKDKVLAYTPTPNGIGPLNVAFLMYNLVKAWKLQNNFE
ncbi:hypothetical protein A3D06_01140 [Candidatus Roizmanbacteria bacterium RIFCSPHIGHO2_02_FULL_40_9]|uniref:Methenyltetrahydrofolate cyclohydrolase n=2 Tax=Candidatus Roizmaniibacteriota TaxID=1752723 RepID=A0A1F7IME6_9BACT|nr:MAG: hypothetical protein A3D06_01140 [Candidatus Roizmanbacteria bacterium RIFCSPHIGHO2_02_FULL_40_9]OGK44544.1 MAG: hypothetical protein A2957_00740 [Candidatus Roizmanbacteria bacterium RIFCSPLOWO2_01_FULL_38_11]